MPLTQETIRRIDILFPPSDRETAQTLLDAECGNNLPFLKNLDTDALDRFRFAALKYSDGDIAKLQAAVKLAQKDWRDLLMAAGFAHDTQAHRKWEPKPFTEPSEIDPPALLAAIQDSLAPILIPLGFSRHGDDWRRTGEILQTLRVGTGLTSRIQTRFFLHATIDAKPKGIKLLLPRVPTNLADPREQGYVFHAGENEETLCARIVSDVIQYAKPLFDRFTTDAEVQKGFEDRTFHPHIMVGSQALIF